MSPSELEFAHCCEWLLSRLARVHVDAGPKDVLFLVTTSKYQAAHRRLVELSNSALIPMSIKNEVTAFVKLVGESTELMLRVLDEKLHENEDYFTHYMDMGTPYYGVIISSYATQSASLNLNLKPAADRTLSAIATYWKIKK
jgi:hypothetical protein